MILEQDYLACLSQASYLVADEASRVAAVVDPRRDVGSYVDWARARGLTIKWTILTHLHADFVAGHLELAAATGAEVCLGAAAKVDFPFRALRDGDVIELGPQVRLEVLETPGHTLESISLVVRDLADPARPAAVLTGDTLFVGDVGRPDLAAAAGTAPDTLARLLHRSLHRKLLALPDATVVYPGHGAGSLCGKSLGAERTTTIGAQKRTNAACAPMSEEAFAKLVTAGQPEPPAYFAWDLEQNRRARPTLDQAIAALAPLSAADALRLQRDQGAQLLDVRDADEFAKAHLPGSINVGLDGRFAQWAGVVLDPARPLVLIAPPGQATEAATRLGRIGFEGALAGHVDPAACTGAAIERLSPGQLAAERSGAEPPVVLDVRACHEREQGRLADTVGIPLPKLAGHLDELPRDRRVVVHCAGGYRSMIAASLLRAAGFTDLADLDGGFAAWDEAGLPVER